jgi:formylglycine-generating enzyme required for sulfatase activity
VVPKGNFMMGSPASEKDRSGNEDPQHEVIIARPFAVGQTEVTFAEWDLCATAGACPKAPDRRNFLAFVIGFGLDDRPMIYVSWDDAQQYAAWLSRITGKTYRLLTEAEWEYAARAGSQTRFSFGDDESLLDQYAWYDRNSDGIIQPVGEKTANAFGLHDMHGNVFEWVEDPWHDDYQGAPTDGSAGDAGGLQRVVRGGSWNSNPQFLRAANRFWYSSVSRSDNIGFRLARTLNP